MVDAEARKDIQVEGQTQKGRGINLEIHTNRKMEVQKETSAQDRNRKGR